MYFLESYRFNEERIVFSTNSTRIILYPYPYAQKNPTPNLGGPYLIPLAKINSEQIIDLGVRKKTIKLLKEGIGGNICDRQKFLTYNKNSWLKVDEIWVNWTSKN